MPYREFRQEQSYAAPEIDFLPKTQAALAAMQQRNFADQQRKKNLEANYKADQLDSKFTTDQERLNHLSQEITQRSIRDIRTLGNISPETRQMAERAKNYKASSDAQWAHFNEAQQIINDKAVKDPYYMPGYDQENVKKAAYDGEVDYNNRGERLQGVTNQIGTDYLKSYNKDKYLSDWTENQKTQTREKQSKTKSGIDSGSKVTAIFFDKNGMPAVTDEHAIQLLGSSPDIKKRYDQELMQQIGTEVDQMMAAKDPANAWMSGKSKDEIVTQLINDPSKNTINKENYGARQRGLAKADLENKQRQNLSTSYDAGDYNDASGLGINNKNIGHSYTSWTGDHAGFGGVLPKTTGTAKPFITISSTSPTRTNLGNGKTSTEMKGKRDMDVEGYELVAKLSDGTPLNIQGKSTDEIIQAVNELPKSYFDGTGDKFVTGVQMALRGTTIDKANIIQKAYEVGKSLDNQYADAVKSGKTDEAKRIKELSDNVKKLKAYAGKEDLTDEEFGEFQALMPFAGIKDTENNELVLASPQDINQIKAITKGFDLNDQKKWSPEMVTFKNAIEKRMVSEKGNSSVPAVVGKPKKTSAVKSEYTMDGKSYTVDDLLKNYTQDEINQAVKAGLLK